MRLDLFTSDWHRLLKPVLPHAATDKELLWLRVIRLEVGDTALYAIATDQSTMGAERHLLPLRDRHQASSVPPVHLDSVEAKTMLGLFTYDKDGDPKLEVTIDKAPIPTGEGHSVMSWAVTVHRPDDGMRLVLRDRRDPSFRTTLDGWRKQLLAAMTRPRGRSLDGLDLRGHVLARWGAAARGAERLRLYTGPQPGDPLLITVETHFAGLMTVSQYLDTPARARAELPWAAELLPEGIGEGGELLKHGSGLFAGQEVGPREDDDEAGDDE